MPGFAELIDNLMKGNEASVKAAGEGSVAFGKLLQGQEVIRIYVDGTPNFGHQASAVYVMKRLIDLYQYAKAVQVVYEDAATGKSTAQKLALLLTGLVPTEIATAKIEYGTCKDITFVNYSQRESLQKAGLGFTGGADNTEVNLAKALNVACFLRLQPFLWRASGGVGSFVPNTIEFGDDRAKVDLAALSPDFRLLPFKYVADATRNVAPAVWEWYTTQGFDAAIAKSTANARVLMTALEQRPAVRLWPAYGLHQFPPADGEGQPKGQDFLLTLLITALKVQAAAEFGGPPIVLALLNPESQLKLDFMSAFMGDDPDLKVIQTGLNSEYGVGAENSVVAPAASTVQAIGAMMTLLKAKYQQLGPNANSAVLLEPTAESITQRIAALGNGQVLVLLLGPVPQEVYNALFARSAAPGLFEGQGTSSVPVSLGLPYLQTPKPGLNISNYIDVPPALGTSGPATRSRNVSQGLRDNLNAYISYKRVAAYDAVTDDAAKFVAEAYGETDLAAYFQALGAFFQDDLHDKLVLGAVGVNAAMSGGLELLAETPALARVPARAAFAGAGDAPLTLPKVYAALTGAWSDGTVDLLQALPGTRMATFYGAVVGGSLVVKVAQGDIVQETDGGKLVKVSIRNGSTAAFVVPFGLQMDFTAPAGTVRSRMECRSPEAWGLDGVPWMGFESPGFIMEVPEAALPVVGGAVGTVKGTDLTLQIRYPAESQWVITGAFAPPYPSIATFYAMAGGVNLVQTLPSPLNTLSGFGLSRAELSYDTTQGKLAALVFEMQTQSEWVIISNPRLSVQPRVTATIINPASLSSRQVSFYIVGDFTIGAGTVSVTAQVPNFQLTAQLTSGVIQLSDLAALFGVEVGLASAVTDFTLSLLPSTGDYGVDTVLTTDWPITVSGTTVFTITGLGFNVQGGRSTFTASISGTTVILPDAPEVGVTLRLSSSYLGSGKGWLFSGQQTSGVVPLGALLKTYLGWDTGQTLGIDGLGLAIATADSSWTFTGKTAGSWEVPFISGLTVQASLRAGYQAASTAPALPARAGAPPAATAAGYFARVSTELVWQNIDITVWFDYNPTVNSYGITWGVLEGVVTGPDPATQDWTATLRFTDAVTLGSLIETMVSWITGSRFGLESPWDILDSIRLSALALNYTFNKADSSRDKVSFSIAIGPINLGFARIDSIDVSYESAGENRGVNVNLKGSFYWQSDPGKPLAWDASKPGTAPAPPGNGNKYLDLRLLAMGQHVTMDCFADADSVQKAIACMAKMPDPTPGKLPAVRFDPQSAWLIGTDFGVLKIDTGQTGDGGGGTAALASGAGNGNGPATALVAGGTAPAASPGYVLTLQAVFNDPHLYALRIALDGAAAKVFKGLDFQIMYRQVSDTVGVYQAEITLPDLMRHLSIGAYSITLPVFGIAVYTNGDFQVDVGFPWNEDFSRSFSIEAIIPPGIPVLGSAGFYFGKLSSATTNKVPRATNGTFNPVLVFGFGMQVGFGKSIEYGVLSAGFSVTVVGMLEGVIAKWNPYQLANTGGQPSSQVQGDYYFWLRGTVGIVGKVYGSVDFAIVKADVNLTVKLLLQITYESYVSITISVIASVDVSVSVRINLGLFKITIHFSFSMRLKETFTIDNRGQTPWTVDAGAAGGGVLRAPVEKRLRLFGRAPAATRMLGASAGPAWGNLQAGAAKDPLSGYLAPGLTVARDEWAQNGGTADQLPCYVALLLLESVPPAGQDGGASARRAVGDAADTSFEALAKMVLRWAVAAVQDGPLTPAEVDALAVPSSDLDRLADEVLVSTDDDPTPIPLDAVQAFMEGQFTLALRLPPTGQAGTADCTYFPAPPQLRLTLPAYGQAYPGVAYTFGGYNALGTQTLRELRAYFDALAVKVEEESGAPRPGALFLGDDAPLSMAAWMFSDYFLLLARQMVKLAQEALRDFKYPIQAGQTAGDVVSWINTTGALDGLYTLADLFSANATHPLTAGKTLTLGVSAAVAAGDTFTTLASRYGGDFPASVVAGANAANSALLRAGGTIAFAGKGGYTLVAGDTLVTVAAHYAVSFNDLLAGSDVLAADVLATGAQAVFPVVTYSTQSADTFTTVAALPVYGGGFPAAALATANAGRSVLQAGAKVAYPGKDPYTVQPRGTLADVANALAVPLADLLANSAVLSQAGLLASVASLAVPSFGAAAAAGDTLQDVASRFGVELAVLGDQPANGSVADLFATAGSGGVEQPYLDVPHLPRFPVGEILKEIQRTGGLQHLSGMASSYTMHGVRFPTTGITPLAAGMWVEESGGTLALPPQAGLYALTGQQFALPALGTDPFGAIFDRVDGTNTSWLGFNDGTAAVSSLTLTLAPGTPDAARVTAVTAYARANRLNVPLDALGAGEMVQDSASTYPFTSMLVWQSAGAVAMPYGPATTRVQSLRLWRLPDALAALPDPAARAVDPRFALRVARYDEATGATETTDVASYGWASTIEFTVRRTPAVAGSPASLTTYEVVGAGGTAIVLLERLLSQVQGNDAFYDRLLVAYPSDTGDASAAAVQTGPASSVTFGIAQVNLSTETRPPASSLQLTRMALAAQEDASLTLLNTPSGFVRLLWEASITGSGGFYLYYYDRAEGAGLPDRVFNDRGEAALTLVVVYAKPSGTDAQNRVAGFMNAAATADSIDTANAVVFAEADPAAAAVAAAGQTLAALAYAYYDDVADVAAANDTVPLASGATVTVSEGVYQAPPGGVALADVAARFGTTVAALNAANPLWSGLPDPLPYPAAILLPTLELTAGTSAHTASLADVSGWYGEALTALAAENRAAPGIFAAGQTVTVPGGPRVRSSTVPAGVQALAALRPSPPPVPSDPADPAFAVDLLLNTYSLLNQQVVENVYFRGSDPGLPAGPTTKPAAGTGSDKVRAVRVEDEVEEWDYSQALPYSRFAKAAPPSDALAGTGESPYLGVGGLLQVSFDWQDYYGNTLVTVLSDPRPGDAGPYNEAPLLTGYTDALVALSQWPSVASSWQVLAGESGAGPTLAVGLGFDASRYQGLLYAAPASTTSVAVVFTQAMDPTSAGEAARYRIEPGVKVESASLGGDGRTVTLAVSALDDGAYSLVASDVAGADGTSYGGQAGFTWPDDAGLRTSAVQQNARQDQRVYNQLYHQLTDPNGMALSLESSLLAGTGGGGGSLPLPQGQVDALMAWLFGTGAPSIYTFLQDRAAFGTTVAAPAASLPLGVEIDPAKVNPAQVYVLWTSFTLARTGGSVLGALETTPGIRSASTRVAPLQDAGTGSTLGLSAFAAGVEGALSSPGAYLLKVATGVDRTLPPAAGGGSVVWAVRLGLTAGEAISYAVTGATKGNPAVFAPQPASNQLITRPQVPIYDYATGSGISATPTRFSDFVDVDLDTWCQQTFAAVDGVLTPQFTAPIQIVGELKGADYLQQILDGKKALADVIKLWMIPVFADETADPAQAREAFYQQLLVRLSSAYATRAAVEFQASVNADVAEPGGDLPPRLFGAAARTGPTFEAATAATADLTTLTLLFSDPLDAALAQDPANYALSGGPAAQSATLAANVVTLVVSADVKPGVTTVTVSNLKDVAGRAVRPPLTQTVTTGAVGLPASTLSFTSPKLTLQTGDSRPLTYLVSAPETVRGAGGEVVSYVELDMVYQGSQIEHQIGSIPGIEDYQASTWLSFVIPDADGPLTAELGTFAIPMVLRAFPTSPTMAAQEGTPTYDLDAPQAELSLLTRWNYDFTYSLPFHYPQDRVYGKVEFNLRTGMFALAGFPDAFAQLAEFVNVFPQVNQDLQNILAQIDATVDPVADKKKVDDAATAVASFIQLVGELANAAGGSGEGLVFRAQPGLRVGDPDLTYQFYVQEGEADYDDTRAALVVSLMGTVPPGMAQPQVLVSPTEYDAVLYQPAEGPCAEPGRLCFVYRRKAGAGPDGSYLTATEGQAIADRTVLLSDMDILQRQDAWASVYLERNRELVPDRPSAAPFVYTTPEVRFSGPLFPTNDAESEVNVAEIGSGTPPAPVARTLQGQLEALFAALLAGNTQPQLTFQVEVTYDYALNPNLPPVTLPVFMQAPLTVELAGGDSGGLQAMIESWSSAVELWFSTYTPSCGGGTLWIDLTLMSDLTDSPMPLLRLRRLYLPTQYVKPALACGEPGA